jgi:hypothetical protein
VKHYIGTGRKETLICILERILGEIMEKLESLNIAIPEEILQRPINRSLMHFPNGLYVFPIGDIHLF